MSNLNKAEEIEQKLTLLKSMDNMDATKLKALLETFIFTKSTSNWDNHTINALCIDENKILSPKQKQVATTALIIEQTASIKYSLPSSLAQLIAEFAQKYIDIKFEEIFNHKTAEIKQDTSYNDYIYLHPLCSNEQTVILSQPKLLGNDSCPFQLTFDLRFPYNPNKGPSHPNRHGGIVFGAKQPQYHRGYGHKSLSQGAKCSIIDWNDRYNYMGQQTPTDHGFRLYGIDKVKWYLNDWKDVENPPIKWKIIFKKDNKCEFYADGKKVDSFVCYSNYGYIGFWAWQYCGLMVENLDIRKI